MIRMRGILPDRLTVIRLGLPHLSCLARQTHDVCLLCQHRALEAIDGSNQIMECPQRMGIQTTSFRLQPLIPPHMLLIKARTKRAFIRTICRPTDQRPSTYQMIGHYLIASILETLAALLLIAAAQVLRKSRRQVIHLPQPPPPLLKSRQLIKSANVRIHGQLFWLA